MAINYLKQHLTFKGRIGRLEFFIMAFLPFLALGVFCVIFVMLAESVPNSKETIYIIGGAIVFAGFLLTIWMDWCAAVRRLHDMDTSGWHSLYFMIPIIGWFMGLSLYFKKGTEGPNQYGPPPDGSERPEHSAD